MYKLYKMKYFLTYTVLILFYKSVPTTITLLLLRLASVKKVTNSHRQNSGSCIISGIGFRLCADSYYVRRELISVCKEILCDKQLNMNFG